MLQDFKAFVMRGNVIDMAVGIIVGVAFGAVVSSLVKDVIMPPIGLALGNVDFSNLYVLLKEQCDNSRPICFSGSCPNAGAVTTQLRSLHKCDYQLADNRSSCLLPDCASDCQAASPQEGRRTGTDNQRMPLLLHRYPYQGQPLPELHFSAENGVNQQASPLAE